MRRIRTFHISSRDAIASHLSDNENSFLTFQLPYKLTFDKDVYIRLDNAQIPISWYSIDSDNDQLNYSTNSIARSLSLPHGNYDLYQIQDYLNANMNTYDVNISYDESTNKLTFTYTGVGDFSILSSSTCNILIGFENNTYTGSAITSVNACDCIRVMKLLILTPSIAIENYISNGVPYAGILGAIPVTSLFNTILMYNSNTEMLTSNKEFSQITLQLTDENVQPVDLNGAAWSLSISFITYA